MRMIKLSPTQSASHPSPPANDKSPSPQRSRGHSRSRSESRGRHRTGRSISRSRSRSRSKKMSYKGRYRSRSRSRSPRRYKSSRYSRSRSRSYSPRGSGRYYGYSDRRREFYRSHSRSPMSSRRRHQGSRVRSLGCRDAPAPSRCLGVFGLSFYTSERELREVFGRFGPLDDVTVVKDAQTGRSRGFAFVYFEATDDAKSAKEQCSGMEIDGRRIRVDYSITQRAHTPTPGIYMGKPTYSGYRGGGYRRSPSPSYNRPRGRRYERSRSRSYSPQRNKPKWT